MKLLALLLLALLPLAAGAQDKPSPEAERVEATTTVVRCAPEAASCGGEAPEAQSIAEVALLVAPLKVVVQRVLWTGFGYEETCYSGLCVRNNELPWARGNGEVTYYVDGVLVCHEEDGSISVECGQEEPEYEPVFETERTRAGITADLIGYPTSDPADE